MRIAFDLRRIQNVGIGRYMRCLVPAIMKLSPEHEYILFSLPQNGLSQNKLSSEKAGLDVPTGANVTVVPMDAPYYSIREQFVLPRLLRQHRTDLLHSPHFVVPVVSPCPAVVTIHDVLNIVRKDNLESRIGRLYSRIMLSTAARRSSAIVTISEYSKSDIVNYLHADPQKIRVIHSGIDERFRPVTDPGEIQEVKSRYGIDRDFILYTGIYRPRKNHATLLRAFAQCRRQGLNAKLVFAGPLAVAGSKDRPEQPIRALAQELGLASDVVFAGFVEEDDLPALYSAARVYACPSLYEGFGFTVLEAMACGTPVVASDATSLPEVAGTAALSVDARSPEKLAAALMLAMQDEARRERMIQQGFANARRFSWDETARATLEVFASVVTAHNRK